jgi:D-3-phosphoglycerate dehydrogenase
LHRFNRINALDELSQLAAQCASSPFFSLEVARVSRDSHDHRLDPLVLDLIEWLVAGPRPYAEVMEAWRTTCARLPIWEEAVDRGLVVSEMVSPGSVLVTVTPAGRSFFATRRLVPC